MKVLTAIGDLWGNYQPLEEHCAHRPEDGKKVLLYKLQLVVSIFRFLPVYFGFSLRELPPVPDE